MGQHIESQVAELVSPYLRNMHTHGAELKASCPFHRTSDPSSPSRTLYFSTYLGVFHCWSCGASGNVRTFLRDVGKTDHQIDVLIPRAVQDALQRNLQNQASSQSQYLRKDLPSDVLPESLLGLFHYAPKLLLEDGFEMSTLQHFEVGYDTWHRRITYPLRAIDGRLLGIVGGSVRGIDTPKYKVYTKEYLQWGIAEREQVDRGETLWHSHRFYDERAGSVSDAPLVVVEGYKACMWVYQAGVTDVVALSGSGMTFAQQVILGRMAQGPIILMLDGDDAGRGGTAKIKKRLRKCGLQVRSIDLPDDAQPDDMEPEWLREVLS